MLFHPTKVHKKSQTTKYIWKKVKKWKWKSEFSMRTKNTPLKDYVLLRDKRRNIVKKKGVVLTRVHYYMDF